MGRGGGRGGKGIKEKGREGKERSLYIPCTSISPAPEAACTDIVFLGRVLVRCLVFLGRVL